MPTPRPKSEAADKKARKNAARDEGKRSIFETVKPQAPKSAPGAPAEAKTAGKFGPRVDKLKLKRPTPTFVSS